MNFHILACIILVVTVAGPTWQFQTSIMIGNSYSRKTEIYTVTFDCTQSGCSPRPLTVKDQTWSSPVTDGYINEIKPVYYKGKKAVLMTTTNGAVVYEYPSKTVLFRKEFDGSNLNLHSAEVMPDGNIVVAASLTNGAFGVLYQDGKVNQSQSATTWERGAPYGHGAVYHRGTGLLFAGGYLTILVIKYESGTDRRGVLKVIRKIPMQSYYDEPNKNEDANTEDGIHDMYQVDGEPDKIFVSTGEHLFTLDVKTYAISRNPTLYTIPSKNSRNNYNKIAVKDKGGIKAISKDAANGMFIAKPGPWFKETQNVNYGDKEPVIVWSMNKRSANDGFCANPDYDLTSKCKINVDKLKPIWIYKARVFKFL